MARQDARQNGSTTDDQAEQRHAGRAGEQAASMAGQMAAERVQERIQNPEFLDKLQDEDIDSGVFDWLSDEYGPLFSGAHIIGNRSEDYERQIKWLGLNTAERLVTEGSPGRLCREHPAVLAVMQGREQPANAMTHTSEDKRVIRDAVDVSVQRKSLSVDATGLETVGTATAESRVVSNEQEETSETRRKISAFLGR